MQDEKKIIANTDENLNTEESAQTPVNDKKPKSEPKPRRKKKDTASESGATLNEEEQDSIIDAPSLDSLIIDDAPIESEDKSEDSKSFEDFFADYKSAIKSALSAARSAFGKSESDTSEQKADTPTDESKETGEQELISQSEDDAQFSIDIGEEIQPEENDIFIDPEESKNTYVPEKPRTIDNVFDFVELFVFTLAAVLILTTFFFKHTIVDGPSMMNTLQHQDHLIISDLFYTPERGDIIVFQDPEITNNAPYVKRVIAVAGDTVTVDGNGKVTVNGEEIDESDYVFIDGNVPYNGKTLVVPEGEVFVLGDHRNNSRDSASFPQGTIKVESILGKVLFRIYPFDKIGTVD